MLLVKVVALFPFVKLSLFCLLSVSPHPFWMPSNIPLKETHEGDILITLQSHLLKPQTFIA